MIFSHTDRNDGRKIMLNQRDNRNVTRDDKIDELRYLKIVKWQKQGSKLTINVKC